MNAPAHASNKIDLGPLREMDGYLASAIVDSSSGMTLAMDASGGEFNIEMAAAGNTDVVRKKRDVMKKLKLNDKIEDILISLQKQYHLIRPLESNDALFIYVALDRSRANLGMARSELNSFEKGLDLA